MKFLLVLPLFLSGCAANGALIDALARRNVPAIEVRVYVDGVRCAGETNAK